MAGQKNYFGKGDVRPDLPGAKKPENIANPLVLARESLLSAEKNANQDENSDKSAKAIEHGVNKAVSLYTGSRAAGNLAGGLAGDAANNKGKKGRLASKLLKSAPAILIAVVLFGGLFLVFGSSSFLGPHLESLFTEATNTEYTAYTLRSNEIFKEVLAGKIEMTDYLKERLEKEGIKVNDGSLEYEGVTVTASNFDSVYNGNVHFRDALTYARRGRIATFFDSTAQNFYAKLGLSRDVFHDYNASGDQAADDAAYKEKMSQYFGGGSNMTIDTASEETKQDENGNQYTDIVATGAAVSSAGSSDSASAEERAKAYLDSVGDKVAAETPACAALEIGNMIATAVASNERYNSAHDYMTKMESLSKSRQNTGGENSAVHSVLNWFTRSEPSTVYNNVTGEKTTVNGSPLESEGMRVVLGGLTANRSNTKKYSLERSYESTNVSIGNSGLSTAVCNTERAAGTLVSLSALAIPGGALVKATVGILLNVGFEFGVKIVASSVLSLLVPTIADVMYSNPFENAVGISGGEYFTEGASNINMLAAQQNSGATGASKEKVLAYNRANEVILAQEAESERANYSPFDASNHSTFFGTIVGALLPIASTIGRASPLSTMSSLASTTGSSLTAISPTYAAGENTSLMTNFGNYCDKISEVGASGNVYCTMAAVHDLSIINTPEDDAKYHSVIDQSIEIKDGKEVIKENSPLAHFISYWMGRYSMPGVYDANIANACKNESTHIPFLNNIVDMAKSLLGDDYCKSVADGSRYINSPDNPAWEETEKWHQLYVLSARIKRNLGLYDDDEDPVTAYQEKYEATHPLDNSRAGYLARISGLEKEDAEGIIAVADYFQRIANYDATARFDFTYSAEKISHALNDLAGSLAKNYKSNDNAIWLKDISIYHFAQEVTA